MEAPHNSPATDRRPAPGAEINLDTPDRMRDLGRALAALLRPGDLVMLTGELGAGKTTLTRGIGEGLGVRGAVTSPTFVIARVHPPLAQGPALVHVDAYRLSGGLDEMEDLDLDVSLPESVVVVEWGDDKVEELSDARLHVLIERTRGAGEDTGRADAGGAAGGDLLPPEDDGRRRVRLVGYGERWAGPSLAALAASFA
ncbi:tRNA (adenosine(37)-N6)-threonylcarbamoyltransferase complex ATPase subunit type 1 TsaE [Streptomyces sp. NBC_01497]|uniref:tRNA (adenosine(37)-N6)-threonylcarbamoyltransferase complex ATPase subunit type 1 TsaE n=1 Tax=Streptomyces sp. NBC_01497 TaxID=2903885 RepID=UPI002E3786D7|nr:tRNA (adenosine(37)-N6)-threonylcarbamoyltransferase complex ATPase subunit type 1 TsaE [Streptomyces sp. NBC_01497]